jgi:hypothetical protein
MRATPEALMTASLTAAFQAPPHPSPFRHWRLTDILPPATAGRLATLTLQGGATGDTAGRRETHNATRRFLDPAQQARNEDCRALATALQSPALAATIAARTGASLDGTLLRIEYCQDRNGFWLEPHTDIGAKRLTLIIYLNDAPPGEDWGTDLYTPTGAWRGRAPCHANAGLAFVPAADTWHGFTARSVSGTRRTLIVNYVTAEWRAVHELAFPKMSVSIA